MVVGGLDLLAPATLLPGVWTYKSMEEHVVRESETCQQLIPQTGALGV
jgi:hypothetical protein